MKKEFIATGKTVDMAVAEGCAQMGIAPSSVKYTVLEEAKKGFLGMGATPAKVKITYTIPPVETATEFLKKLLENMQLDAKLSVSDGDDEVRISISGEAAGVLIGHHGDTLDSLQYLTNLAANKKDGQDDERPYTRIVIDIENYRSKREETLRNLARRTAERVRRTKRSVTLEPMSAQERRIIHSEVQNIEGMTTFSVGQENNRKVVVSLEKKTKA
ncbi:MAG: protein jag [Clostridia bacterium]|nr:protein jag [Clostridia bacterium]